MKRLLILIALAVSLSAWAGDPIPDTSPISIEIIPASQVREFLLGRLRTPLIRDYGSGAHGAQDPIAKLIDQASRYPLFTYVPNGHPAARLNFTAYLRLLSLRDEAYTDPLFGDLYLLHELHHITTMPYDRYWDYGSWHEKMTLNEKESTLFSEAIVHLEHPEIRTAFSIRDIWADRFLTPDFQADYLDHPGKAAQRLLSRFTSIGNSRYEGLDAIERRSWIFDRSNELWSAVYWKVAPTIEEHMALFYMKARLRPQAAALEHRAWILAHTTSGLPFAEPNLQFNAHYSRLNLAATLLAPADLDRWARGFVEDVRTQEGIINCRALLTGGRSRSGTE